MKKTICLLLCWMIASTGFSQYYQLSELNDPGNPGGLNTETDQASFTNTNWTQILGSGAIVYSASISIPFAFNFDGAPVTNFLASPTGYLTFDLTASGTPPFTPQALPSGLLPDNTICAAWGVNLSGANDAVITQMFGTAPNRQFWILWRSVSTPGSASAWNYFSIVLEETSDYIYLVDMWQDGTQPNMTMGVQINNLSAEQVAGSPTYKGQANTSDAPGDNDYYLFIKGVQPSYDISLSSIDIPIFLDSANAPFTIMGGLKNYGTATITSFDINYSVNGGSTVSNNISGVSITTNSSYQYSHPTTWTPALTGTYNIMVWASNINGNADQNNTNDTLVKQTDVYSNSAPRLVLHEGFTSSTTPAALLANISLYSVLDANPGKYTLINYQMFWPGVGDPYYTQEANNRRNYYGLNSIPHLLVDGGFDANTASYTQTELNNAFVTPSFLSINVNTSVVGQTVNINAEIIPSIAYPSNNMVVHMVIIEKRTYNNVETNGETEFRNVMKKMVPNSIGTSIAALAVGDTINLSTSYTFQGNYRLPANATDPIDHAIEHSVEDFANLEVIVFVQDTVTKEVFNSAKAGACTISLALVATNVTCNGSSNGSIDLTVSNGAMPYTYNWSNGDSIQDPTGLAGGTYTVTVTDSNACIQTSSIQIIEPAALSVGFTVTDADCDSATGSVSAIVSGGVMPYTYLWSSGGSSSVESSLLAGTYIVTVTDINNCQIISSANVGTVAPPTPKICLITVDDALNKNKIVWEYSENNLDSFLIHRDITGTYTHVGGVSTNSISVYTDMDAGINPKITSYRYKIQSKDNCGGLSTLSGFHETIHLTINQGVGGALNLIWDGYEGLSFAFYRILKDANGSGNFVLIDSVSNTNTSYTDFSPGASDSITYVIEVVPPNVCVAAKVLDFTSARSNPVSNKSVGMDDLLVKDNFNLYPNPSFGTFTLSGTLSTASDLRIVVSDVLGKEVYSEQVPNIAGLFKKQIHLFRSGTYLVQITTGQTTYMKKIVIQ